VLRVIDEQVLLYKKRVEEGPINTDEYNCTSTLWKTMGIPCSHMLRRRLRRQNVAERVITVNDFAKQRWVDPNDIDPPAAIERQPLIIEIDSDDEDGGDGGDIVQQERTRLIQFATTRILNATPAQLTVLDHELHHPIQRIFNPAVVRGKGRPQGALGKRPRQLPSSTKRDASHFESQNIVLHGVDNLPSLAPTPSLWDTPSLSAMLLPSSQRSCSNCGRPGHNVRTCIAVVIR
jgi:hypothetical protein